MIVINNVNSTRFSLNGIEYLKNFLSFVAGDRLLIYNAYDMDDERCDLTLFSDFTVDGIVYSSAAELQSALLNIIFSKELIEIVNNLTEGGTTKALSAEMGKNLFELIENISLGALSAGKNITINENNEIGVDLESLETDLDINLQKVLDKGSDAIISELVQITTNSGIELKSTGSPVKIIGQGGGIEIGSEESGSISIKSNSQLSIDTPNSPINVNSDGFNLNVTDATINISTNTSAIFAIDQLISLEADRILLQGTTQLGEFTVSTLPTPISTAYATVTDALNPIIGQTLTGGGAVKVGVFYNGSSWVVASGATLLEKTERFTNTIALHTSENKRNDQASMIRLDDGRLAVAYTHFFEASGDIGESSIYVKFSSNNGKTWSEGAQLIPQIEIGSYIPSFYKKSNGNVLVVFFVREATTPAFTSTLRQIEFSSDLANVEIPLNTIIGGNYFPIASDRLFFDELNNRLLMPYPELTSGLGSSQNSVYSGKLLVSTDEGLTWSTQAFTITGKIKFDGFGGCIEPGVFKKDNIIVYYYRTLSGNIYANNLTFSAGNYTAGTIYNLGIKAANAQSSIKYIKEIDKYLATYMRVLTNPVSVPERKFIDLAISNDGLNWSHLTQIGDNTNTEIYVNAPNLFYDNYTESLYVTHSISRASGNVFDLEVTKLYNASLVGDSVRNWKYSEDPLSSEFNLVGDSEQKFGSYDGGRFGNLLRNVVTINADIDNENANTSYYGQVFQNRIFGNLKNWFLGSIANISIQTTFNNVKAKHYANFVINGLRTSAVTGILELNKFSQLRLPPSTASLFPNVLKTFGIYQEGSESNNYFEGKIGVSSEDPRDNFDAGANGYFAGKGLKLDNSGFRLSVEAPVLTADKTILLDFPTNATDFLAGNGTTTVKRAILPSDLGVTASNGIPYNNSGVWSSFRWSIGVANTTIALRTATGQLKASDAVNADEAVTKAQLDLKANTASPTFTGTVKMPIYTVGTLPSGTLGDMAFVTDAVSPTYLDAVIGGGTSVCPVFFNGTIWVSH